MILGRLLVRIIGLISTIILARILAPADFGLVAIATLIVGVLDIVSEFGFDLALIKDQRAGKDDYDTVWTLSIARGFVTACLLVALAGYLAEFMNDVRLREILYWLALGAVVDGFKNSGIVDFRKHLQFDKEIRFLLYGKLAQFVAAIACAVIFRNYWALIVGILVSKAAQLLLSYMMHPFRPSVSFVRMNAIISFSKWLILNNILVFLNTRSDTLILGKFTNAGTVGTYTVGQEIANLSTTEFVWPIMRAVYPGFAKLSDDREKMAQSYLAVLGMVVLCALPIAIGLGLLAETLVLLMLGKQWVDAIPIIQILVFLGAFRVCWANAASVFLATGRPYLVSAQTSAGLVIGLPAMLVGVHYAGAIGVSIALVVAGFGTLAATFVWITSTLPVSLKDILGVTWRPVSATIMMAAILLPSLHYWSAPESVPLLIMHALVMSGLGATVFAATIVTLWVSCGRPVGSEQIILRLMHDRLGHPIIARLLGSGTAT